MSDATITRSDLYFGREVDAEGNHMTTERRVCSVSPFCDAEDAAEAFVSLLVDEEMRKEGMDEGDIGAFDGLRYTVELRHPLSDRWERFSVRVEAKLTYQAKAIERKGK